MFSQAVWQDDFSRHSFIMAAFFWLVSLMLLVFFWFRLPSQIPLFYSHPWGEEQLASPPFVFLLPGGVLAIMTINFLATSLFPEEKLILRTLALASAVSAFLGLFAVVKILELSL